MRKGELFGMILFLIGVGLCIANVTWFAMKDKSEFESFKKRLETAEGFYERETERAAKFSRESSDKEEAENARYEALKKRIEVLEAKDKPMKVILQTDRALEVVEMPRPKKPLFEKPRQRRAVTQ